VTFPTSNLGRYSFAVVAVAIAFAVKLWLMPLTGAGAPFVLFFAAVMVTSLAAGVGPAVTALLLSLPIGSYTFVITAGYRYFQATFQSLLFAIDGFVVIYLTSLIQQGRQNARDANTQLQLANEEVTRAEIRRGSCSIWRPTRSSKQISMPD
jgi:K+-sensing histidine kinase KdpD